MSTDESAAPASGSWSPLTTIVIAIRSAVSAIALIAVLDRQFILSKWLHWTIQHWKDILNVAFPMLPFDVAEPMRPVLALALIIMGTAAFDLSVGLSAKGFSQPRRWQSAQVGAVVLIANAILLALVIGGVGGEVWWWTAVVVAGWSMLIGVTFSPRMFLWLAAFTAAFIGANEIALLWEQNVPLPPPE